MDIYELDRDEAIILQAANVSRDGYDESEFEDEELHELVLTNKNLIYIVSDIDSEDEDAIKVPLDAIKVIGGKVQAKEMIHELYGRCLQVQFKHGIEYWRFGRKGKTAIPQWIDALTGAIMCAPAHSTTNTSAKSNRKQNTITEDAVDKPAEHKTVYCSSCGAALNDGSKFCHECGAAVGLETPKSPKREIVYEGNLHKCPSCGEVIKSFETNCPACGHEFRETTASGVVKEFERKLEAIEKDRPTNHTKRRRSSGSDAEVSATDQRIITLIRNFPIPNTKEDLYEFLVLASSNINLRRYYNGFDSLTKSEQAVSDAWEAKFEQAFEKARISFGNTSEFRDIQRIYDQKHSQISKNKRKTKYFWIGYAVIFLLITVFPIIIIFSSDSRKINAENDRLNAIVEEVYVYIEKGEYVLARSKASTLVFSGSTTMEGDQAAAKWDVTRQQLLDIIDKAEYGADYNPEPREIRIGASQDDLKDDDYLDVKKQFENRGFTNIKTEPVADLTTGWWTTEGSVDHVSVGGDVVFSDDSTYSSDVEIIIYYHVLKSHTSGNDEDHTKNEATTNPVPTDTTVATTQPATPEETTVSSIVASIEKGSQYTYGHDEWSLYCATAISDTLIKIERWEKTLSSQKTFNLEYEVGAIKITDAEYGFAWLDNNHTAFVIQLQDEQDSDFKKPQTITFTISGTDSDTNIGANYTKDGICYSYQNDDWHLYRAIPLTDTIIKVECWYRSMAFGSFNYGYDVLVIDLLSGNTDFEWTDDEHSAFTISIQDTQNSNLKKATFVAFTLDK